MKSKKVAIIHDWLCVNGGAEVVLKHLLHLYPQADIYTMIDTLPKEHRSFLGGHTIYTSCLQKYKFTKTKYKYFMPFMPYLVEQFDLCEYDLVISSSHFVAKGVITHPEQLHIAYIYSPVRYAWDLYYEYEKIGALGSGIKKLFMKLWLHKMRIWDFTSAHRPDFLIADSNFIQKRIQKSWRRDSTVIYPPVEIEKTVYAEEKEDYYVTLSRLVEYKRIDIIIEAFNEMPDKKLVIIGDGRLKNKLQKMSNDNIVFKGYLPREEAMNFVSKAKAFIFMPKEDFGIVPIEAQGCGTPVIAYRKGGARETILENKTGIFVEEQNAKSLKKYILKFENMKFSAQECKKFVEKFAPSEFEKNIKDYIKKSEEKNEKNFI